MPEGWHELGGKQLRYVYQLFADGNDADTLKTLCLLQWGLRPRCRSANQRLISSQKGSFLFEDTPLSLAELLPHLAWLAQVPSAPIRLAKINRREAIAARQTAS